MLWATAHDTPKTTLTIAVRQKIWSHDETDYSYNAAQPHGSNIGNMGTRVGSVVLCGSFETKNGTERFARQLIQYQISDILGDDLCYSTFNMFDVPTDAVSYTHLTLPTNREV